MQIASSRGHFANAARVGFEASRGAHQRFSTLNLYTVHCESFWPGRSSVDG